MEKLVAQAFSNIELHSDVRNGKNSIASVNADAMISSRMWRSAISLGIDLRMVMWSLSRQSLVPEQRCGHRRLPSPRLPEESGAHYNIPQEVAAPMAKDGQVSLSTNINAIRDQCSVFAAA